MSNRTIDPGVSIKTYDVINFVRKVTRSTFVLRQNSKSESERPSLC